MQWEICISHAVMPDHKNVICLLWVIIICVSNDKCAMFLLVHFCSLSHQFSFAFFVRVCVCARLTNGLRVLFCRTCHRRCLTVFSQRQNVDGMSTCDSLWSFSIAVLTNKLVFISDFSSACSVCRFCIHSISRSHSLIFNSCGVCVDSKKLSALNVLIVPTWFSF